ncbi:unnamed protein product [Triticum turgidum subsp. durum]|uniref:Uncharacterized protein n=1 Tax=Triticum turgidum subsp. durum TaxID=4567 RepID=A0A9R1R473_TRITD|nr:unnamed protein product [Triticum turgidum subsp. durum]
MSKRPGGTKKRLKRGLWSPEEDEKLMNHIAKYGNGCWSSVPKIAGLERCGKSCRLRWINYLRPDLKRGAFSQEEEDLIIHLHSILGNKWSQIAAQLPGRTDNEVKNFWNSFITDELCCNNNNKNNPSNSGSGFESSTTQSSSNHHLPWLELGSISSCTEDGAGAGAAADHYGAALDELKWSDYVFDGGYPQYHQQGQCIYGDSKAAADAATAQFDAHGLGINWCLN